MAVVRINVGCGTSPTDGYFNYDNSYSVRFAGVPFVVQALSRVGFASAQQLDFAAVARAKHIRWARAKQLAHADKTVDVVYSSHMVEHLDRREALQFLNEALRVLRPGGIIRLALPDLRIRVDDYLKNGDADQFIDRLYLTREHPRGILRRLKWMIVGDRHHAWMYDAKSAVDLLAEAGFLNRSALSRAKPPFRTLACSILGSDNEIASTSRGGLPPDDLTDR